MLSHPWTELQLLIKEKWLTQKAFSAILWKKVSELNELLKWKRNITIQRDYLLHQTLWTPIKYRILKQVDYDYSLLDIDNDTSSWATAKDLMWKSEEQNTQDSSSSLHSSSEWQISSPLRDWRSHKSSLLGEDLDGAVEGLGEIWPQQNDEDLKNRVQIFRNF